MLTHKMSVQLSQSKLQNEVFAKLKSSFQSKKGWDKKTEGKQKKKQQQQQKKMTVNEIIYKINYI